MPEEKTKNPLEMFFKTETIIRNVRPCNSPEEIQATMELNHHMERVQQEFRSMSTMSRMAVEGFVFTT